VAVDGAVRPPSRVAFVTLVIIHKLVEEAGLGLCTCSPRQMLLRETAISVFIYNMASPEEAFINLFEGICVIVVITACYNYCLHFLFDILFSYVTLTGTFPCMNVFHLGIEP
jgi:hypothetical protein